MMFNPLALTVVGDVFDKLRLSAVTRNLCQLLMLDFDVINSEL